MFSERGIKYIFLVQIVNFLSFILASTPAFAQSLSDQDQIYTSERHANKSSCRLSPYTIDLLQSGIFPVYNNGANKNYSIGNARIRLSNHYRFKGLDTYDQDVYRQSQTIGFKRVKNISDILTKLRKKKYSPDIFLTHDLRERGEAINADKELRRYIRKDCGALFTLRSGNFYRTDTK